MSVLKQVRDGQKKARDAFSAHVKVCGDCQYGPLWLCADGNELCQEWSAMDAVVRVTERMERERKRER